MLEPMCDVELRGGKRCRQPATPITLRLGSKRPIVVDLCDKHAEPLIKLARYGRPAAAPPKAKGGRTKVGRTEIDESKL